MGIGLLLLIIITTGFDRTPTKNKPSSLLNDSVKVFLKLSERPFVETVLTADHYSKQQKTMQIYKCLRS